jgi:hypothetical protein
MSISGLSAASSAAYIQQSQNPNQAPPPSQVTAAQTAAPTQIGPSPLTGSTQQPGGAHHRRHQGDDNGGLQSSDALPSGSVSTGSPSILNTLV